MGIILKWILNTLRRKVRLDSSASPYGPLTEYAGHGKECWGLVNSKEYHDGLSDWQFFEKYSFVLKWRNYYTTVNQKLRLTGSLEAMRGTDQPSYILGIVLTSQCLV